ncbi:MAG TPA: hypothetical protein VHX68_18090, partial [Planctomycetaceae bacterium]|nr:hypothetical protein [Planctomycetaceae bacterium]
MECSLVPDQFFSRAAGCHSTLLTVLPFLGATPTALRFVLPAFFVAKLSTFDQEQEFGDAAPEGDPTG